MTIAGFLVAVLGVVTSATAHAINGQWLLGAILAVVGYAFMWRNRKGGPRDYPKEED